MRTTLAITLFAALTTVAACKKDDKKTEGSGATASGETEKKSIPDLDAAAFYADWQSLDGLKALDKYGDGVIVSGTVKQTIEEMDGSVAVWLDSGNGTWISLGFKDAGKAVKDKGIKQGDTVKAQCDVGGSDTNYVMNIDCELKS